MQVLDLSADMKRLHVLGGRAGSWSPELAPVDLETRFLKLICEFLLPRTMLIIRFPDDAENVGWQLDVSLFKRNHMAASPDDQ